LVEEPVVERGVLTAPGPMWDAAVRLAEVIGGLAAKDTVGLAAADGAAVELGVSRRRCRAGRAVARG
jgi:putative transposase